MVASPFVRHCIAIMDALYADGMAIGSFVRNTG